MNSETENSKETVVNYINYGYKDNLPNEDIEKSYEMLFGSHPDYFAMEDLSGAKLKKPLTTRSTNTDLLTIFLFWQIAGLGPEVVAKHLTVIDRKFYRGNLLSFETEIPLFGKHFKRKTLERSEEFANRFVGVMWDLREILFGSEWKDSGFALAKIKVKNERPSSFCLYWCGALKRPNRGDFKVLEIRRPKPYDFTIIDTMSRSGTYES